MPNIIIRIDEKLKKEIKVLAAENGVTITSVVTDLLNKWLKKKGAKK